MRLGTMTMTAALLACVAGACRDKGGELRDATARRRAELANRDTTRDRADDALADTEARLPAFADDTVTRTAVVARPDSAPRDSAAAPPPAATGWAVAPRQGGSATARATLRGLRAASNPEGFDRLVLDFGTDAVPRWRVGYAARPPFRCGSGQAAQVEGARFLGVRLQGTQAHDDQGQPTVRQRELPLNMPVMRAMVMTCDFEGEVELVVGVAAGNPYRVMELANPTRLVIDVQRQP
jgi:hypothetical protein